MKNYYAIQYPCGIAVNANTGRPYGSVYRFDTLAERAAWVANGGDFQTGSDWREEIKASDSFVRYSKAQDVIEIAE